MTFLRSLEALVLLPLALFQALAARLLCSTSSPSRPTAPPAPPALPRPATEPQQPAAAAPAPEALRQACQGPAPAACGPAPSALDGLSVVQLRTMARERLGPGTRFQGRRLSQARRADLLEALAAA